MKNIIFLFAFLVFSNAFAELQTYSCSGQRFDDNGYPDGEISGTLQVLDPSSIKKLFKNKNVLSRSVASKYFLASGGDTISAELTDDGWIVVSSNIRWAVQDIWIKANSLGKKGRKKGAIFIQSGRGTEGGDVNCTSKITEDDALIDPYDLSVGYPFN